MSIQRPQDAAHKPGLRERNKEQKRHAICAAAREHFVKRGYDAATTRAIAQAAGIATGTLFTYAVDKRDLLFLLVNDRALSAVNAASLVHADRSENCLSGLITLFRPLYEVFAHDTGLFREALKEFQFPATIEFGAHTKRFQAIRAALQSGIVAYVKGAQNRGWMTVAESADFVGETVFAVYQAEVRRWLSGAAPAVAAGLDALHRRLALLLRGLAVHYGARDPQPLNGKR